MCPFGLRPRRSLCSSCRPEVSFARSRPSPQESPRARIRRRLLRAKRLRPATVPHVCCRSLPSRPYLARINCESPYTRAPRLEFKHARRNFFHMTCCVPHPPSAARPEIRRSSSRQRRAWSSAVAPVNRRLDRNHKAEGNQRCLPPLFNSRTLLVDLRRGGAHVRRDSGLVLPEVVFEGACEVG